MSAHTPGPWTVIGEGPWIVDSRGATVALSQTIRNVGDDKANAHLIAAAPELLDALKAVEYDCGSNFSAGLDAKVRAAITKAECRQS